MSRLEFNYIFAASACSVNLTQQDKGEHRTFPEYQDPHLSQFFLKLMFRPSCLWKTPKKKAK